MIDISFSMREHHQVFSLTTHNETKTNINNAKKNYK